MSGLPGGKLGGAAEAEVGPVAAKHGHPLLSRLGYSSPAAALLYQHAAHDRDAEIARALDAMLGVVSESSDDDPDRDG